MRSSRSNAPPITAESLEASAEATFLLPDAQSLFTARIDPRTSGKPGARIELAVDPERFHFFDPVTGESLIQAPSPTLEPVPEYAAR